MLKKKSIIFFALLLLSIVFLFGCVKDKCENVNCNDNNPCTVDSCMPETGLCYNVPKACPADKECDVKSGRCESITTVLDKIESAIKEKISTSSNPLDMIEEAIKSSLL